MKNKEIKKENLVKAIITFLNYDQHSDTRFHDPSDKNKQHQLNVKRDATKIADISIQFLTPSKK